MMRAKNFISLIVKRFDSSLNVLIYNLSMDNFTMKFKAKDFYY